MITALSFYPIRRRYGGDVAYRVLIALCALSVPFAALPQLTQLCPADARTAGRATLYNEDKRTLGEIFGVVPGAATALEFATNDWNGRRDAVDTRIDEVLRTRPRSLAPQVIWAEAADLRSDTFSAALKRADGGSARLTVSGSQICVRDASGDHWFFRAQSDDVWSD
jgi:hypothetical protein